ncbi:M64 family metallopeptidase [uncultured Mucilaginibacter sp.]|uniref:M64 family metallopeptidase n=1 Tax=uncultured Mucilaginibacter sp. TaxID=797541 RepID=UPI0025F05E37|nr:M64 family metallopeptidase [uncultured Mucilaginibacter sp.]
MKLNSIITIIFCLLISACGKKTEAPKQATTTPPTTGSNPGGGGTTPEDVLYHKDGDVNKLYYNMANGVNIVVLGDGFVKEDLKKNGVFDTQVKKVIDYLFTVAPFKQYKQYFNTYVVYAESAKQGAAVGSTSSDNKFGSYFSSVTDRLLIAGNYNTCYEYVDKAIPRAIAHLVVLVVNDSKYGGSGGNIAVVSTNEASRYVMVHEVGHTFCGLGDEYIEEEIADNYPLSRLPMMANIDVTADASKAKWSHFVGRAGYGGVSSFEGAYYRSKGMYRPENNSLMSSLNSLNFNAPSREAIVKRILMLTGVTYSFENFLREDAASAATASTKLNINYAIPKNDFLNMDSRLQELKVEAKRLEH